MLKFFFSLFFLCVTSFLWSQTDLQKQLEERRTRIHKEIQVYKNLLKTEQSKEISVLTKMIEQNTKIRLTEKLINNIQEQVELLNSSIDQNQNQMNQLTTELKQLREDYAKMILKSYKSKSEQSRAMFLLSSKNFLQAYKRMQYMKQYANYRKKQGEEIKLKSEKLEVYNKNLIVQKRAKEKLIIENEKEKISLEEDKNNQQVLMQTIRKDQKKYLLDIKKKQDEEETINRKIKELIRAAIAAANASAAKKAGKTKSIKTLSSSTTFELTPEAKALAADFKANEGKLPWPVEKGLLTLGYGNQPHPLQNNLLIHNSGIEITTEEGTAARAIFGGEVLTVQILSANNKAVYIQHGDFITVYLNLENVFVNKGDKIVINQKVGKIYTNQATGKTILKFLVLQNTDMLNPQQWLIDMQ